MSLPLKVEPSPQIRTSSSSIARTSRVPVTARPSGVVLKWARPPDLIWNDPQARAASPSSTRAARQSTSRAVSAPYTVARPGTEAMSGSSYWPMSAVYGNGTPSFSRNHATATELSRPPEKAIPTRSPTGREVSTLDTSASICTRVHDHAKPLRPRCPSDPSRRICSYRSGEGVAVEVLTLLADPGQHRAPSLLAPVLDATSGRRALGGRR